MRRKKERDRGREREREREREKERNVKVFVLAGMPRARRSFFNYENWLPSKQPINSALQYWQYYNELCVKETLNLSVVT